MKKILIHFNITLILLCTTQVSYSQTYTPFPDSNAIWSEFHAPAMSSGDTPYYYRNAITNKDTAISTKTYHQIFYSLTDSAFTSPANYYYVGGLRENNKQIFFIPKDSINEYLIYDFSKNVGDTVKYDYSKFAFQYCFFGVDTLIIADIDSVMMYDGMYRKRFRLTNVWGIPSLLYPYWIEGVGSDWGLLVPVADLATNGCSNTLVCFKQNNNEIYFNNYFNNCFPLITSISDYTINGTSVSIYPNPVTDISIIKWNIDFHFSLLEIYNIIGKTILKTNINNVLNYTIEGHIYKSGIYFIKLSDNIGNNFVTKFIKE